MRFLLVLSAPSGGGKTTLAKALLQARPDTAYSVSATTRPIREGERDGVDYHFLTRDEFLRRREAGEFLESATYGGHLYGTLRSEIDRIFAAGRHAALADYPARPEARLPVPTPEHFLPLLYALALQQPHEIAEFFNVAVPGSISMTSVLIGAAAEA